MKKRLLIATIIVIVLTAGLLSYQLFLVPILYAPHSGLIRMPNSTYKYELCAEGYAHAHPSPNNPHQTNYTFHDPFRHADDTIVPHLLDYDPPTQTVNFTVDVIINQVATFHETISHVHAKDGIAVILPNTQNQQRHSLIPQFIVTAFDRYMAILDYTCPSDWVWQA